MAGPISDTRKAAKTALEDKVRRLLEAQRAELARQNEPPEDNRTLAGEIKKRLAGAWQHELAPSTKELYIETVGPLYISGDPIGSMHPDDITRYDLEEWRDRLFHLKAVTKRVGKEKVVIRWERLPKPRSPYSVDRYESLVHKYLREIRSRAPDDLNPLKLGKPENVRWLERKDREAFLACLWPHPEKTFALLCLNGLDTSVACGLLWSHYDGEGLRIEQQDQEIGGTVRTRRDLKRARRFRTVPCGSELKEHLDSLKRVSPRILTTTQGNRCLPSNMRRSLSACLKGTPWEDVTPRDLRRSGGKWMLDGGAKINDVAAILGNDVRVLLLHYDVRDREGMKRATEWL